jgi:hypothetical protein
VPLYCTHEIQLQRGSSGESRILSVQDFTRPEPSKATCRKLKRFNLSVNSLGTHVSFELKISRAPSCLSTQYRKLTSLCHSCLAHETIVRVLTSGDSRILSVQDFTCPEASKTTCKKLKRFSLSVDSLGTHVSCPFKISRAPSCVKRGRGRWCGTNHQWEPSSS